MKNIFVTGGTGFVGQWLVQKLLYQDMNVSVLFHENFNKSQKWSSKNVDWQIGEIQDSLLLKNILKYKKIDTVFHLAAQAIVTKALEDPLTTMRTNVNGTISLMDEIRKSDFIERVVVASSDKSYGDGPVPYNEDTPLEGKYPYDCSKACEDKISQSYRDTYNLPISILRCGNIYGGGDFNWNRIFPEAIKSCYEKRPMTIRSDGTSMKRDYIYVEDVISAYLYIAELNHNEVVNASYGYSKTVLEILKFIQDSTNTYVEPIIQNNAPCEISEQYLSNNHIKSLGWTPEYSFHTGIKKTVGWYYDYFLKRSIL